MKAADCLRLSREASTPESQNHWVSMADFWFRMAKHVEDRDVSAPSIRQSSIACPTANNQPRAG